MKQLQRGFTLIELVMVIVILGILAAVALPKFIGLQSDAQLAAVQGVAGALSSGSAINYSANIVGHSGTSTVSSCDTAKSTLQGGAYPTSGGTYSAVDIAPTATWLSAAGSTNVCTLALTPTSGSQVTATFVAIPVP